MIDTREKRVVVLGAGPAGLTAARELTKFGVRPVVIEKYDKVGGLARTDVYKGFHFDMGGHRFFTKVEEVKKVWHEVLGDRFLVRPRLSRIYYNGRFFHYPLKPLNALLGLGIWQSVLIVLSYVRWHLFPHRREDSFEQWVTNRFGERLFRIFFKTYTEKVWGIPCSELRAEWAAQRIKDLSLRSAVLAMFLKPRRTIKTLIEEFEYPALGPGMMWNAVADEVRRQGGTVWLESDVVSIRRTGTRIDGVVVRRHGREELIEGTDFISSIPLTEVVQKLSPPPPDAVLAASRRLVYRDFLTVCLVVDTPELFPDNWIYVHSPDVKVGRIQNFKNWSPAMVPDAARTSLGLEYFCTEGDALWRTPDAELIALGRRELSTISLARESEVVDGCVVRVPKAYPVYDADYREHLDRVRAFAESLTNFQTIGRNGLHRYNNQDHAMLTGMLAIRNLMLGEENDVWSVNTDAEYHEEEELPDAVLGELTGALEAGLQNTFVRLDSAALALAVGSVSGVLLWLATLALVLKGGEAVGPRLGLLAQYLPGYRVTVGGSFIGLAWGLVVGGIVGWTFAFLRNVSLWATVAIFTRRAEWRRLRRLLDVI